MRLPWILLGAAVATQMAYPLTAGLARAGVTIATVLLGACFGLAHARLTRGPRWTVRFCLIVVGGSAVIEAVGVATGWPFGAYRYGAGLGPHLAGVPLLVPLAWAMMAYPSWLAAVHLVAGPARVLVAGWALAAWDAFLDPQMVAAGHWVWLDPSPTLPGVPGVPIGNYLAWLAVGVALMAAVAAAGGPADSGAAAGGRRRDYGDLPPLVFFLWTYAGSMVAHAALLGLPGSAVWGGLAMGLVAVPVARGLAVIPQRVPR